MDVLLAIHQSDLRLAIDLFLREEPGVNVVGVVNETEGFLALLYATRPELLLIDWDLPGRPLAEVLAAVHQLDTLPKIIGLSKDEDVKESALAAKVDFFVVKGEPPEQLLTAIHQVSTPPESPEDDENKET